MKKTITANYTPITKIIRECLAQKQPHFNLTVGVMALGLALSSPLQAATFTVMNNNDAGDGSLRSAIELANATLGTDDIVFDATVTGTITLTSGELSLTDPATIIGPGDSELAINGNGSSRVISNQSDLGISGLTITRGYIEYGAGIKNTGTLTIENSSFISNGGCLGAGIFNIGSLTVTNTTLYANYSVCSNTSSSPASGSGILNRGDLMVIGSTIKGNGSAVYGGGIHNEGSLTVTNSTITSNNAHFGAGILNRSFVASRNPTTIISNSTISGNVADIDGGGIDNEGSLTVTSSTVSGNFASYDGGSIFNGDNAADLSISNTIIIADQTGGSDCYVSTGSIGTIISGGYNIDSDGTCNLTQLTDLSNINPLLGPLQDNGGPTQTHALLAGSPAIDAGNDAECPATDQRGVIRPQGVACDIGAFEYQAVALCELPPTGMVSWWDGDSISGTTAIDIQDDNDGTLIHGATTAPGIVGQAFSFDGVDDYISVPNSANLSITNALTMDAWVKPEVESLSGNRAIATKEGSDILGIITGMVLNVINGQPELAVETSAGLVVCRADSPLKDSIFTHIAGTYDGSVIRFYVNGSLAKTCNQTGMMTTNRLNLSIGARASSNSRFFKGLIDELEIFNRALSGTEIKGIYDAGSAGKCKQEKSACDLPPISVAGNCADEVVARSLADIDAYVASDFGRHINANGYLTYKNLRLLGTIGQAGTPLDVISPCRITVNANASLSGSEINLHARMGMITNWSADIDASGQVCLISDKRGMFLNGGNVVNANALAMRGNQKAFVGIQSTLNINGPAELVSTGTGEDSQVKVGNKTHVTTDSFSMSADNTAEVAYEANVTSTGKLTIASGSLANSETLLNARSNLQAGGDIALTSGGKTSISFHATVTTGSNLDVSAKTTDDCSVASITSITYDSKSGNCADKLP